jgi:hypothetical protein
MANAVPVYSIQMILSKIMDFSIDRNRGGGKKKKKKPSFAQIAESGTVRAKPAKFFLLQARHFLGMTSRLCYSVGNPAPRGHQPRPPGQWWDLKKHF